MARPKSYKDAVGVSLVLGDKVVFNADGRLDKLFLGRIVGFTPKKVRIQYKDKQDIFTVSRFPEQLAALDREAVYEEEQMKLF